MKAIRILIVAVLVMMLAALLLGTACTENQGEPGVGIESIVDNGDGTFTLNLTDGSSFTTSNLTGPQGAQGPQGSQGDQGPPGEMPVLEWHRVTDFFGSGADETATFYVPMDDFRLTYFVEPSVTQNVFAVFVFSADDDSWVGYIEHRHIDGHTSGIEYIRDGRGEFYLKIFAAGLEEWTIYVAALY